MQKNTDKMLTEKNKILKIISKLLLVTILITFFFISYTMCFMAGYSNFIYFDMKNQSIIRCEGTISKLYIVSKDNKDDLFFFVSPDKKGKKSFSITDIDKDYLINVTNTLIDLDNFKLRPEMEYKIINHSNGDSPDGELLIRTDRYSNVIYADKISCNK